MKNGLDANIKSMTQAQKTLLRYQYVMANTSKVQGDFSRTANTWHNQIVILKMQLQQLATVIGSGLIQAIKPFVMQMNTALSGLITFAQNVVNALGKIFGWEMEVNTKGFQLDEDALEDIDSSGIDDIGESADDATKSVKKLKDQLQGFDKLNVLRSTEKNPTKKNKDDSSGSGNGTDQLNNGDVSAALRKTKGAFESEIDNLYDLGRYISDKLSEAMESIDWDKAYEKAKNFGTGLAEFLNGLISKRTFENLGNTIAKAIMTAIVGAKAFSDKFDWSNLGDAINAGIKKYLDGFDWKTIKEAANSWAAGLADLLNKALTPDLFDKLGEHLAELLNSAFEFLNTFGENFDFENFGKSLGAGLNSFLSKLDWKKYFTTAQNWGKGIANALNAFVDETDFYLVGESISKAIKTAVLFFLSLGSTIDWKDLGVALADTINGAIENFPAKEFADTIDAWVQGIFDMFVNFLGHVKWSNFVTKMGEFLGNLDFSTVAIIVGTLLAKSVIGGLLAQLPIAIAGKIGALKAVFSTGLGTAFSGVAVPAAALTAVLAGLVLGLGYVFATNENVRKSFFEAVKVIKDNLQPAFDFLRTTVLPDLKAGFDKLMQAISPLGTFLRDVFASVWLNLINPALKYFGENIIPPLVEALKVLWSDVLVPLGNFLLSSLSPTINSISAVLRVLFGTIIIPLATFIGGVFLTNLKLLAVGFEQLVAGTANVITKITFLSDAFFSFVNNPLKALSNGFVMLRDIVIAKVGELALNVVQQMQYTQTNASGAVKTLVDYVGPKFEEMRAAVEEKMKAVKKAASDKWDTIRETAETKIEKIKDKVADKFEEIKDAITERINSAKDHVGNAWKTIKDVANSKIPEIVTKVGERFSSVVNAIKKPFDNVKKFFESIWNNIKIICGNGVVGIHNEIGEKFNNMINKLKGIGKSLQGLFKFKLPTFHFETTTLELANLRITYPSGVRAEWHRKAYDNPLMFTNPTVMPTALGYQGFGDGQGGEMVYGHANLMKDIREATGGSEMTAIGNRQLANDQRIIQLLSIIAEKEFGISGDALFRNIRDKAQNYTMRTGKQAFEF